jgi:hypothetical protein
MPQFRLGGFSTARKVIEQLGIDIRQGQGLVDDQNQYIEWPGSTIGLPPPGLKAATMSWPAGSDNRG